MRAKSIESLKRMALSQGAVIETDGKRLNAARSVVKAVPKPKPVEPVADEPVAYMPEATPEPAPATVEPDPSGIAETVSAIDRYASATFLLSENTANLMDGVRQVLEKVSQPKPEQPRPIKWVFTVKRDMRGLMERIDATPVFAQTPEKSS